MEKCLSYSRPISKYTRSVSLDDWYKSMDLYEAGDFAKSIVHLLRYINPPVEIPDAKKLNLTIPHGSVNVSVKMDSKNFSVSVPFLKFGPSSLKVPAMRQIIEGNFSSLTLAQTVLKDGELWMEYGAPIEDCEPYKIYAVLDEICREADSNDDYYIDRFKLEHINEIKAEKYGPKEREAAAKEFKAIIEEGLSYADYLEGKRYYDMGCDALAITVFRLKYAIFPQGILGRDVQDVLQSMFEHNPPETIASKTKEKLKKLLNYDKAKFEESLYHPNFFMPIKPRAEIPRVKEQLDSGYQTLSKNMPEKAYMYCALYGMYELYYLWDVYTVPPEILKGLEKTLSGAAGRDWKAAAEAVYGFMSKIMELEIDGDGKLIKGSLKF
ncbi:MAG: hypothetical protein MUD12_06660 [Spirochaetes bacterium]|jgi:hypothetical protein|nr:hypothetical protein [Spirochaetota bacterium]